MLATLQIECIGSPRLGYQPAFVRRILGISEDGLEEKELRGHTDYSQANSVGSRGVFKYYFLAEGAIYHVSAPQTWKRTDEYYCRNVGGRLIHMSMEEVVQWLQRQGSGRTYLQYHDRG